MESKITFLINNIFNNFDFKIGSFRASPSIDPNYNYHWTRDSCLSVDIILDSYLKGYIEPKKFFTFLEKFITFEKKVSEIHILSGLGEPKYKLDGKPFTEKWGRPQNDGPALRGLLYLKIIENFPYYNKSIFNLLEKNVNYIKKHIYQETFDLWEEVKGYHFYTSYLQLILLIKTDKYFHNDKEIKQLQNLLNKFIYEDHLISSINTTHDRLFYDTSLIMSFLHSNTNPDIWLNKSEKLINILELIFKKLYPINSKTKIDWYGRYPEDIYYGGNPWIICTLAKLTFQYKYKLKNKIYIVDQFNHIWDYIEKLTDSPEQIDRDDGSSKSARFLTWNYVELLRFIYTYFD